MAVCVAVSATADPNAVACVTVSRTSVSNAGACDYFLCAVVLW